MGRALSVWPAANRERTYQRLADRAGVTLDAAGCWMLLRIHEHPEDDIAARSERLGLPEDTVRLLLGNLADRGLVTSANGAVRSGSASPTPPVSRAACRRRGRPCQPHRRGQAAAARLVTARRDALSDLVQDSDPEHHAELAAMLTRLARHLAEGPAPVPVTAERAPAR